MENSIFKITIILIASGFTMNANASSHKVNVPKEVIAAFPAKYHGAVLKDFKIEKAS